MQVLTKWINLSLYYPTCTNFIVYILQCINCIFVRETASKMKVFYFRLYCIVLDCIFIGSQQCKSQNVIIKNVHLNTNLRQLLGGSRV